MRTYNSIALTHRYVFEDSKQKKGQFRLLTNTSVHF